MFSGKFECEKPAKKYISVHGEQSNIESYQHNAEFEVKPEIQNGLSLTEYVYCSIFTWFVFSRWTKSCLTEIRMHKHPNNIFVTNTQYIQYTYIVRFEAKTVDCLPSLPFVPLVFVVHYQTPTD